MNTPTTDASRPTAQDPPGSARRRRLSGMRLCAALSTAAVAATTVGLAPASAMLGAGGVEDGRNITVFHNIDFVAAFGYPTNDITVEVVRGDVVIGTATGTPVDGGEGPALEVNHGPEGAPQPGDCWEGHTPDIMPGDLIRITNTADPTDVDEVVVDDITFSGPAFEENPVRGEHHDILVKGVAKFADGAPIPIAQLDSAEFRDTSKFRGVPDVVQADPAVVGGFIMRYHPPYNLERNQLYPTIEQRKASLLNSGGHAIGFGHVEVLPPEAMLVDGIDDVPGPALGCEGSVAAVDAVRSTSHAALNKASVAGGSLQVSGVAFDASEVEVNVGGVVAQATLNGGSWTASVPMASLAQLPDGAVKVSMSATRTGGDVVAGRSMTLMKDTVAPSAPTASPAPRAQRYIGEQRVTLRSAGNDIFYTLGANPANPTQASRRYTGPVSVNSSATLKAVAVDAAGNASPMLSGTYNIVHQSVSSSPRRVRALSGALGGTTTVKATWRAPSSTGFARITGYQVRAFKLRPNGALGKRTVSGVRPARARSLVMALPSGTYRVQVRAINRVGASAWSLFSGQARAR
jgi:hypothetical protein